MVADVKTTALSIYERAPDPLKTVEALGRDIAISGLFSCENPEQGRVFAWECIVRGTPPLALAEDYHVIDRKLSMKADAMLARFSERGGKHKLVSRSPELASIELTLKSGEKHVFSLSWEEAQAEPFVYVGSEKENAKLLSGGKKPANIKTKYLTPRSRSQMLWARVVSDGVRALDPGAVRGKYTPEEISDWSDDDRATPGDGRANGHSPRASVVDQAAAAAANGNGAAEATAGEVVDAEFEVVKEEPKQAATAAADSPELATEYQIARIKELAVLLQCGEKVEAACQKRGCNSVRSLRKEDAGEMLDKLEANYRAKQAKAQEETAAQPASEMPPCGPATEKQIEAIKGYLKEFAQFAKADYDAFMERLKTWLNGRKLADIDATQAAQLADSIRTRSLPTFIQADLDKHAGK